VNQAIQFPLAELHTECEMVRNLVYKTAWTMDQTDPKLYAAVLGDKVSMCNYRANRMVCNAADQAMQVRPLLLVTASFQ
jgi:alkylation response protein AidB-like acyl-CoA dehydrogenase